MPPTPIKLPKGALMEWNGNKISDHNRSQLSVSVERIEGAKRMANGTLRKYVIADKRKFSVSWEELPHIADWTVDGYWAGREIESFYNNNAGAFILRIVNGDGVVQTYNVVISDFSMDLIKRGAFDFWNVDITMEEV